MKKNILTHAGQIAHETAKELAELEYHKFHSKRIEQDSEFDKLTKQIESHRKKPTSKKTKKLITKKTRKKSK